MRKRYSLLVVDDEVSVLRYVKSALASQDDIEVLVADGLDVAFKIIEGRNPTIVLLDIHLGQEETDGITSIQHIRRMGYKGIVCIFTGDPSPVLLFQAALSGADDYMVKGVSCDLVEEVRRLIMEQEDATTRDFRDPITETAFLRSLGLRNEQAKLLSDYASLGYPRIKELSCQLGISETGLWKRLSRIRDRLGMDCMTQIAHLLTALSIFGKTKGEFRDTV